MTQEQRIEKFTEDEYNELREWQERGELQTTKIIMVLTLANIIGYILLENEILIYSTKKVLGSIILMSYIVRRIAVGRRIMKQTRKMKLYESEMIYLNMKESTGWAISSISTTLVYGIILASYSLNLLVVIFIFWFILIIESILLLLSMRGRNRVVEFTSKVGGEKISAVYVPVRMPIICDEYRPNLLMISAGVVIEIESVSNDYRESVLDIQRNLLIFRRKEGKKAIRHLVAGVIAGVSSIIIVGPYTSGSGNYILLQLAITNVIMIIGLGWYNKEKGYIGNSKLVKYLSNRNMGVLKEYSGLLKHWRVGERKRGIKGVISAYSDVDDREEILKQVNKIIELRNSEESN